MSQKDILRSFYKTFHVVNSAGRDMVSEINSWLEKERPFIKDTKLSAGSLTIEFMKNFGGRAVQFTMALNCQPDEFLNRLSNRVEHVVAWNTEGNCCVAFFY